MCFKLEASTTASSDVHNKQRECHIRLSHTSSCSRHSQLGCSPKPLLPLRTKFAAAADARGDRDASARYSLPCHPGPSSSPSNLAHNLPCARAGSMSAPPLRTRESAPTTRISGQPQSRSRPWLACPRPRQTGRRQPEARRLVGTAERVASLAISLSFSRPRSRDSSFSSFSQLAHASQFPCTSSPRSPHHPPSEKLARANRRTPALLRLVPPRAPPRPPTREDVENIFVSFRQFLLFQCARLSVRTVSDGCPSLRGRLRVYVCLTRCAAMNTKKKKKNKERERQSRAG